MNRLSDAVEHAPRDVDELAAAQFGLIRRGARVHRDTAQHRGEAQSLQGVAEQLHGQRIAFLNDAGGVQHQDTTGQTLDERRQTRGQMLFAGRGILEVRA